MSELTQLITAYRTRVASLESAASEQQAHAAAQLANTQAIFAEHVRPALESAAEEIAAAGVHVELFDKPKAGAPRLAMLVQLKRAGCPAQDSVLEFRHGDDGEIEVSMRHLGRTGVVDCDADELTQASVRGMVVEFLREVLGG